MLQEALIKYFVYIIVTLKQMSILVTKFYEENIFSIRLSLSLLCKITKMMINSWKAMQPNFISRITK